MFELASLVEAASRQQHSRAATHSDGRQQKGQQIGFHGEGREIYYDIAIELRIYNMENEHDVVIS